MVFGSISWMTVGIVVICLAALVAAGAWFFLRQRKKQSPPLRITIHPAAQVVIIAGGERHCPTCGDPFQEFEQRAYCSVTRTHEIHEDCRTLANNRCPTCNGALV